MISSPFFQKLFTGNIQGDFLFGKTNAKLGEKARSGFSSILCQLANISKTSNDTAVSRETPLRGHLLLEQVKRAVMASGISLEGGRVNADAMAEFGNLLVQAGFNKREVQEMISDLTSSDTGKGIALATLFARASQLSKPEKDAGMAVFLDISTLPYIETILGRLGMDGESIHSVLEDAKVEGSGIDIGKLAANLRRKMESEGRLAGTVPDHSQDVLDMMRRIDLMDTNTQPLSTTLEKMISGLSGMIKKNAPSAKENPAANEISEDLVIPYLQQLAAPLGNDGKKLLQLIGSAVKENGGFDGEALLAKLVQVRQELSAAPTVAAGASMTGMSGAPTVAAGAGVTGMSGAPTVAAGAGVTGMSGTPGEARNEGKMSLSRFVSALEARVSTEKHVQGVLERGVFGQPTAQAIDGFLEKISSDSSASRQNKWVVPAALEQRHDKQGLAQDVRQAAEKSSAGANGKEGLGQNTPEVARPAFSAGDPGRNTSENGSGKDETAKFMDVLTSAEKNKVKRTGEQSLSPVDGFMKAAKTAEDASALAKTPVTRTLPGYLLDQVSRQIVNLRTAGENEITLQLKPPHLGRMKLNIEHSAGGIKVGIVVESDAAKEMLLSHTNELKAALGDQGLRLDKIDVETQSHFDRSMAQAGREFGQSGGHGSRWTRSGPASGNPIPEGMVPDEPIRNVNTGRLDLVA